MEGIHYLQEKLLCISARAARNKDSVQNQHWQSTRVMTELELNEIKLTMDTEVSDRLSLALGTACNCLENLEQPRVSFGIPAGVLRFTCDILIELGSSHVLHKDATGVISHIWGR